MKSMPQEVEIWYLIPSIRRELTKIFISDFGLNQKKSSEILGITESAISQYSKSKRASELKFSKDQLDEIYKSAEKIMKNGDTNKEIYQLCIKFRGIENLCKLHKKHDKSVPRNCDLCMGI